jgi:hypothetical protein
MTKPVRLASSLLAVIVLAATGAAVHPAGAASTVERSKGDTRVFARIGTPGEPALTLVTPHAYRVYVSTFESVEADDTSASKVFAYSRGGTLERTYVVHGQTPGKAHAVQVAARDRHGRLYLLDQSPARVIRLKPRTGKQHTWATFADIPTCSSAHRTIAGVAQCSNAAVDNPPEPDYAAWLPDGSMLVTDYTQQVVWRIPPHGGKAKVWLSTPRLDGEDFGPAGIVMLPGHHHRRLLMDDAAGGLTSVPSEQGDVSRGVLYRVVLGPHERFERLVALWHSQPGAAPDGFAVSRRHHHVYVAMAGPATNQLVEVAPDQTGTWREVWHVPSAPSGIGESPVSWDSPTSAQFLGSRVLVTNQAYFTDDSSHWAVLDVEVRERGLATYVPRRAGRS